MSSPLPPETPAKGKTTYKYGFFLDEPDEEKAAKRAVEEWEKNARASRLLAAHWKRNQWWREGRRFVQMEKAQDLSSVRLVQPLGIENLPPMPNLVDQFARNVIAVMIADPPRPEAEPTRDDAKARDAAQAASRVLGMAVTESGSNTDAVYETALDVAATYGSGFVEVCYNPKGGGLQPMTIAAKPGSTTVQDALLGEGPLVRKYVLPGGQLSDSAVGAQKQWEPKIELHVLNGNNVRFMPRICQGVEDAIGVVVCRQETFGALKSKYPTVASMSPEDQWTMVRWVPKDHKRLIPAGYEYEPVSNPDTSESPPDDYPAFVLRVFIRSHDAYPYGAKAVFAGGKWRLEKGPLMAQVPDGEGGMRDELLDLPLAQFRWRRQDGNPYGFSDVEKAGPLDEQRTTIMVAMWEYLHKFLRPRPLLPMGTTVQPEELGDWEKPLTIPPGGKPEFFPMPAFPREAAEMLDRLKTEMMELFGITPMALGQVAGSVRSAEQQKTAIEQSVVALSSLRASFEDGFERLHRLYLQAVRAYWTVPMLIEAQTEDGSYQVDSLLREDLGNTSVVRVRRGSGTMLSPTAKNDLIMQQAQVLGPMEAARLMRDNLSPLIGLRDEPATKRIKRQLQQWKKGPAAEMQGLAPTPQLDPMGNPVVDPMTGQPVMQDPLVMAGQQVFALLPVDDEPQAAMLQHYELFEAVNEMERYGHPPGWNQALIERYMHARQAAGIQTIAEQQQAAQAQQQAQLQQQQQDREHERSEKTKDREFQREERAASEQAAMERDGMKRAAQAAGAP